jgi:hypothetical protein
MRLLGMGMCRLRMFGSLRVVFFVMFGGGMVGLGSIFVMPGGSLVTFFWHFRSSHYVYAEAALGVLPAAYIAARAAKSS